MKFLFSLKALKFLVLFFLGVMFALLFMTTARVDVSTQDLNPILVPDAFSKNYKPSPPRILFTYGDGHPVFFKNENALIQSAINKGFDITMAFHRSHMDAAFYAKNKHILEQLRGAGYWLWKPYFLLNAMRNAPEGTLIAYADSGVVFKKDIADLLPLLEKTPIILVGQGKPVPLRHHLKMEVRHMLSMSKDDKRLDAQNIWGFFILLQNTPQTRAIIQSWLDLCERKGAITDEPFDPKIQEEGFEFHQHDQSLLSVIISEHPSMVTIIPKDVLRKQYGIVNVHRHPERESYSSMYEGVGIPSMIANVIFNNPLIRGIRKLLA